MCGSKASADAIQPRRSSRSSPATASKSFNHRHSSSTTSNPSSSTSLNFTGFVNFSSASASSSSASSSKKSLSKLKEYLPETSYIYDFSELLHATKNFLSSRRLSTSSWRCTLRGRDVAIFQRKLKRPLDLPQLQRRLSIITQSHHSSIIKLLGASISGNYIYLVYEFVEGANLNDCLRNKNNPGFTVLSSWISRMQIASDLAHGLDYMHHCAGPSGKLGFVHNHIKSSSVIVVEPSLNARICHFGTADLCGEAVEEDGDAEGEGEEEKSLDLGGKLRRTDSKGVKLEGTRGYMSPEYRSSGVATQKSDVYAFGVVMLELLSGNEALKYVVDEGAGGYRRVSVIESAREAVEGGRVWRWIDRRLKDSYPMEVAEKMVMLGLECVEDDPDKRLDMSQVDGAISKMYLESRNWADKFGFPVDFSVSMAPR